jgi:pimeloyl-ACP methyl ester carboxylesterase
MYVEVEPGVRLYVSRVGEQGAPVVFLYGAFVGNQMAWLLTTAAAASATHRAITFDLRAHGLSDKARLGHAIPTQVDDLGKVLAACDVTEPCVLVGHSFGALIALAFAVAHPTRCAALVLVDPPLPPTDPDAVTRFLAQPIDAIASALPLGMTGPTEPGAPGRRARKLMQSLHFLATETDLPAAVRGFDVSDDALRAVEVPLDVVVGDASPCRVAGERLRDVVPGARLHVLGGGHFLPLEQPAALTTIVMGALDRLHSSSGARAPEQSHG